MSTPARFNLWVYLVVAVLLMGILGLLGTSLAHHGDKMSEHALATNDKIIGIGLVLLGHIAILIGQSVISTYQHKANDDLRNELQATTAKVEIASQEVQKATNGDLDRRIREAAAAAVREAAPEIIASCRCKCETPSQCSKQA